MYGSGGSTVVGMMRVRSSKFGIRSMLWKKVIARMYLCGMSIQRLERMIMSVLENVAEIRDIPTTHENVMYFV